MKAGDKNEQCKAHTKETKNRKGGKNCCYDISISSQASAVSAQAFKEPADSSVSVPAILISMQGVHQQKQSRSLTVPKNTYILCCRTILFRFVTVVSMKYSIYAPYFSRSTITRLSTNGSTITNTTSYDDSNEDDASRTSIMSRCMNIIVC